MPAHRLARSTDANKEDYPMRISTQSDVTAEIFGGIERISRLKEAGLRRHRLVFFRDEQRARKISPARLVGL